MARRTRSFLFDNISKRLVQNTNKTAKEINTRVSANTTANTDILTKAEVQTVISNTSIATLSDTTVANVANEQVLQYNANTGKWENETLTLVSSVDGLSDTNLTSLSNGDYLVYSSSGSEWINRSLDLSGYVTDTEIADYSNTAQMNTAIAASNTALKSYVDTDFSNTYNMGVAIASSNTAMKNYVDAEVAGIVNSAPAALDTLNELAAALGDDANFSTTTSTALGNRLRIDVSNQSLTGTQQTNALTNLGITATVAELNYVDGVTSNIQTQLNAKGTSSFSGAYADLTGKPSLFSGSYNDLSNKPTIPTNNNQLTNGAGYTTTTAQELSRTGLDSSDDLGSGSSAPLSAGWYSWGNGQPSNSPDNYALMFQLNDGGQPQQWVMAYGGSANNVDLYARRRTGGTWDTTWTKFWNSTDFSSTNVSNWNTAYGWGNHASAGYSTFSGSYNDLSNKPTIPTNNNQLTNGAGYITVSSTSFFNNQGRNHNTTTNFNSTSLRAGVNYLQGGTNGPTGSGQWYGFRLGLGQEYGTQTGTSSNYASEFYWGRKGQTSNNYYIYTRDMENGSWGSWVKMNAGYADSAGSVAWSNVTSKPTIPTNNNQLTNGAGYITDGVNYTVNNAWLRENGDNANVKLYGNSRQMAFRTDGQSIYDSGVIQSPFVWLYGGNSGYEKMWLSTGGVLTVTGGVNIGSDGHTALTQSSDYLTITTPSGNYQVGPGNTTHCHHYTDRGSHYFDTLTYIDGAGIRGYDSAADSRFSIYYDLDNTAYYMNAAGTSRFNVQYSNEHSTLAENGRGLKFWNSDSYKIYMSATSNATWGGSVSNAATSDYNMYFRMTSGTNRGFVFKNNTTAVAQIDGSGIATFSGLNGSGQYLEVKYNATGGGGIRLRDNQGTINSYLYGNGAGEGGLLDSDASWFCRSRTGTSANIFYCDGNNELYVYTSYVRAVGSFRAPIYYDFNNTSYYAHLDSTSDSIRAAGNIVAYYSDERLKDISGNIENALDKVCTLDGFYYRPNEIAQKYGYKDKQHVGLSAQQVQKVLPEVIKSAPVDAEYMTVDYASIVPLLVEAIKELKSEIEELKK